MKRTLEVDVGSSLWIDKYRPITLQDFIGNGKAIAQLKQWLIPKSSLRAKYSFILLNGPPGVGKSLAATLVAESLGYRVVSASVTLASIPDGLLNESSSIQDSTRKQYLKTISDESARLYHLLMSLQSNHGSMFVKSLPPVLVLDDFDGITMKVKNLLDRVKQLSCPTILICNDRYDSKLKSIGAQVLHVPFYPIPSAQIDQLLKNIAIREKMTLTSHLTTLAQQCKGDVRFAIMSMQFHQLSLGSERENKGKKPKIDTTVKLSLKDALKQSFLDSKSKPGAQQTNSSNNGFVSGVSGKAKEGSGFNDVARLFVPNNSLSDLFRISEGDDGLDYGDAMFTWRIHDTYPKIENLSLYQATKAAEAFSLADLDYPGSLLSRVESNIKVPWLTAGTIQGQVTPFPPLVQTMTSAKKTESDWRELTIHLQATTRAKVKTLKSKKKKATSPLAPVAPRSRILLSHSVKEFFCESGPMVLGLMPSIQGKENTLLTADDRKAIKAYNAWSKDLPISYYPEFSTNEGDLDFVHGFRV